MIVETDQHNGVPYIHGECAHCSKDFIIKFYGAGKYKCPYCKKLFILRRKE